MLPQIETITWILTSDRKPPKDGEYLVTNKGGKAGVLLFNKAGRYSEWWSLYGWDAPEPIAWAQLPKGYKNETIKMDRIEEE